MSQPLAPPPSPAVTAVNRRQFLSTAAVATAAVVVSLPVVQPEASAASPKEKPKASDKPVDVGALTDYTKDGVTSTWAKAPTSFFVTREDGKLFASSSLCTHSFCTLQLKDDQLYCKCHKSHFTLAGELVDGPAKTSLPRYAIKADDKGKVIVDPTKEFSEAKWDDSASFISVKKDEKKDAAK